MASGPLTNRAPADTARRRLNLSYRAQLVGGVCGLVLFTGATITWLAYRSARNTSQTLVNSLFREVSDHAVTNTRNFVLRAAPLVDSLRQLIGQGTTLEDSDQLARQNTRPSAGRGEPPRSGGDALFAFAAPQLSETRSQPPRERVFERSTRALSLT